MRNRTGQRHGRSNRGVATVEMAVLAPVALLLFLGALDLGRIYWEAITVASAARAGTSYGSLRNALSEHEVAIK